MTAPNMLLYFKRGGKRPCKSRVSFKISKSWRNTNQVPSKPISFKLSSLLVAIRLLKKHNKFILMIHTFYFATNYKWSPSST